MTTCPFCRIANPDAGIPTLLESPLAVAFLDIRPVRPGHVLVVPRRHQPDFWGLSEEEQGEMMALARQVAAAQRQLFSPQRVGMLVAGFDVAHAHLHVVPLHEATDLTSEAILKGTLQVLDADGLAAQRAVYAAHFQAGALSRD